MRILQVNSAESLGGGETHVIELSEKLRDLGHHVLVAGRPQSPLDPDIVLPLRNAGDFISALRLRKILRDEAIDVVHAHVARDYTIVAAAAWRLPHLRVVFTRHLLHLIKGHALYRRVDGWLAPTAEILSTLKALKPKRATVIPNWVSLGKFSFRPHDLHSPVTIGLLGQISAHKGHEDAIAALRLLGLNFRLLVAGHGKPEYLEALKRRAEGVSVEFLGFVSPLDFFQMVDILIAPSWHEPFGIVLLEAMASGIPVISTLKGGPMEIVQSGEHGMLVFPRKPTELAAAVHKLANCDTMRLKMVEQARTRVESEYDINKVVPQIERFYAES